MTQQAISDIDNPLTLFADSIKSIPLKIGAPSFVFPAGYAANVELLGGIFDEIQLLILEPLESSPLDDNELSELVRLKNNGVTYSVHLPVPSGIAHKNENGVKSVINIIKTFMPIGVENFVLHVENSADTSEPGLAARMISKILEITGVEPEMICVENLHTGFEEVWENVESTGASICFDAGHLLFKGGDPIEFIDRYGDRIRMAHIHGTDVKDHRPLNGMPEGMLEKILQMFIDIKLPCAVIIENYSVDEMTQSLRCLCDAAGKLGAE
ncbi:MAG: cobamide remodeling phosphodiesterase CbiR [Nitrospinota bacterium]